jgi:hypothetical protein
VSNRLYVWTRALSFVFLLLCLTLFVVKTWHWPLIGDAALMHYIVFLMHHGMAPYRDIVDPNLPTTLVIEAVVIHFFGGGSLAWRLFDLFLLAVTGAAMVVIARPYDWIAGFFAASLFALVHGRDGTMLLGERDLTMTAFLVIGYAFLFEALRTAPAELANSSGSVPKTVTNMGAPRANFRGPALSGLKPHSYSPGLLMLLFGFFCGAAATIKPTVLLLPVTLLVMAAIVLRRRGEPFRSAILSGVVGTLVPMLLSLAYVWHKHVTGAFFATLLDLIPYFARLGTRSFGHLVVHSISSVLLPFIVLWVIVILFERKRLTWERAALLAGIVFGLASFYLQRKGYSYHRYPSEAFFLLLASIDLAAVFRQKESAPSLRRHSLQQRLALAGILIGAVFIGGGSTLHALRLDWRNQEFDTLLQADLNRLGDRQLDGHIQCLDMGDGCIPTLYNMRLVQATGFLYDCYLFSPIHAAEQDRYREAFWQAIQRNPPTVFVISSNDCEVYPAKPSYNYQKTTQWQPFDIWLKSNYHLVANRVPPHMVYTGSSPSIPLGYKIYLHNQTSDSSATQTPPH